jgi:UDP-3-O-[3-hydroxymyristoyl] glucosamine N-acyltransferase
VEIRLAELAAKIGASLEGDGEAIIRGVAGVRDAQPGDLAFVAQARYAAAAEASKAAALIVGRDWSRPLAMPLLRVENPEAAFAQAALLFAPPPVRYPPGVHPAALVSPEASIGAEVHIGPYCVVQEGAVIGDRTALVGQVYVAPGVTIGRDCLLYPQVSIREHCQLGDRVILHNGTVVGSDGFGYQVDRSGARHKQPQIGIVVIADDVEVGANCAIDRARFGKTRIGKGVKIDNLVQIAHNVVIGDHAVIVAQVGIAGSTTVGSKAILAGQSGVAGHLVIGEGAVVAGKAGVTKNVPAGAYVSGFPAAPHKEDALRHAHLSRLPELKARVAELEKRIKALEAAQG